MQELSGSVKAFARKPIPVEFAYQMSVEDIVKNLAEIHLLHSQPQPDHTPQDTGTIYEPSLELAGLDFLACFFYFFGLFVHEWTGCSPSWHRGQSCL